MMVRGTIAMATTKYKAYFVFLYFLFYIEKNSLIIYTRKYSNTFPGLVDDSHLLLSNNNDTRLKICYIK